MQNAALDRTFHALSDGTRRAMIHALAGGEPRSASELGSQFRSAQPTISKHLKVLEDAKLVERRVEGRVHRFRLRDKPLLEAGDWIARHRAFWTGAVDQLEALLKETNRAPSRILDRRGGPARGPAEGDEAMTRPAPCVELQRRLSAPVARVFEAFSSAELVARWLTPAPDVELSVLELDFRVGGRYRFAYETPQGQRMLVGGSYRIIERPVTLAFSWLIEPPDPHAGIESLVTITLRAVDDDETALSIRHERWGRADADARHAEGWAGALDQLQRLLSHTLGSET
jgi:uncharacterized protein YndB with AHSA1/START domain/DNA-binding transcriptional ArsR family regulator